ncbi:YT521-B-like domain-containing protein [Chaetomium strumarium]|uniref:YT521-B-like domain-containing protein n=1 Tax=Chaetomium strumarium TaxID=1170767 RepID=A0AAJ0LZK3_9PEZI|nr:YT521-B-like domain-containing protein [Chaetomium strumarium]
MSGTPPTTRIGLDARAAELKEKLLRSRSQSQARANSAHPSPSATKAGVSVGVAPASPANISEPGVRASDQTKPAQSMPREDPQPSASTSSGSEASELRQMISSLLAPTPDSKNDGSSRSNEAHKAAADQERPKEGEGSSGLRPAATNGRRPGLTLSTTSSTRKASPPNPSHVSHKAAKEANLEEGEVTSPDEGTLKGSDAKSPLATPALRTDGSRPAAASGGRRESARGNTDPAPVRKGPQEGEATRSGGAALRRGAPKTPSATPVSRSSNAPSTAASDRRWESARKETEPTSGRQPAQDPTRRDSGSKPHTAASKPAVQSADSAEKLKTGHHSNSISQVVTGMGPPPPVGSAPARTAEDDKVLPSPSQRSPRRPSAASLGNIKHEDSSTHHTSAGSKNLDEPRRRSAPNHYRDDPAALPAKRPEVLRRADESALSGEAFTRLLNQVPDLRDWLEMTNYDDVETRTRKLDRFRRAKVLAAEKRRIEEEEKKLMEEEALEMALTPSTVVPLTGVGKGTPVPQDTPHARPDKRAREESPSESRQAKVPRSEAPPHSLSEVDTRTRQPSPPGKAVQPPRSPGRGSPPSRLPRPPSPSRHEYRRPREPSPYRPSRPGPRPGADNYGSHDDYPPRPERSRSYRTYPVPIDLGRKGDTRYFILKSFTEENVRQCMDDGIWTTQVQNGGLFTKAYKDCRNVIFFFSVNKSKAFQGYARMASAPSPDIPTPRWVKALNWDTSHPFYVEWLSKTSVDFFRIGHLKNAYNENLSVLVGKDGQEIEPQCGADLLREMEAIALGRSEPEREDGYPSRRESGGGGPWSAGAGYHPDRWGYGSRYKGDKAR